MTRALGLAMVLVLVVMGPAAIGGEAATDTQVQALENRIKELEQRLDEMDKKPESETL